MVLTAEIHQALMWLKTKAGWFFKISPATPVLLHVVVCQSLGFVIMHILKFDVTMIKISSSVYLLSAVFRDLCQYFIIKSILLAHWENGQIIENPFHIFTTTLNPGRFSQTAYTHTHTHTSTADARLSFMLRCQVARLRWVTHCHN